MHKFPKKLSHLSFLAALSFASLLSGCGMTTGAEETPEGGDGSGTGGIVEANNPPTATSGEIVLAAGETSKSIDLSTFVSDPDGDSVKITAVSTSNGQVKVLSGTNISYSSSTASKGGVILYVASDGEYEVSGKVTLKSAPPVTPNIPPLAVDDVATVQAGSSIVLDVLANDIDPDGGKLSIKSATSSSGVVAVSTDGKITYTPKIDFSNVANIEYSLSDGVATVVGRVAVTVLPYTMNAMLSWTPPAERVDGEPLDPTTDISSYNVLYKELSWSEYKTVEVLGSKSQVLLQNLGIGDYTIRIAALDHVGQVSEYSEINATLRP